MIHGIKAIATVLDPKYKMELIEFYFTKIYGDRACFEIEKVSTNLLQFGKRIPNEIYTK